jgi:hypothetical protein
MEAASGLDSTWIVLSVCEAVSPRSTAVLIPKRFETISSASTSTTELKVNYIDNESAWGMARISLLHLLLTGPKLRSQAQQGLLTGFHRLDRVQPAPIISTGSRTRGAK